MLLSYVNRGKEEIVVVVVGGGGVLCNLVNQYLAICDNVFSLKTLM